MSENTSLSIKDYSLDEGIASLLEKIKMVEPENLSIREAYQFIDELKQKAIFLEKH